MKRARLVFCMLVLAMGACVPSAPSIPADTATIDWTLTTSSTGTFTQTETATGTPTATLTELPPTETPTATLVPVFFPPPATPKPKRTRVPSDTPPPPPPSPTDTSSPETPSPTFTPTLVCERETTSAWLSVASEIVKVGDTIKVTVTIRNEGCVALGLPQYRLYHQSDGPQPIFSPENPEPVVHSLAISPGESDSQEFELVAVASGQATLTGSISYEVHIGYPGPAYWGYTGTPPMSIMVAP